MSYARSGNVNIAYQVLGNGPVDIVFDDIRRRLVEAREIDDLVIRAIESRSNQRVHAGRDTYVVHLAFAFELGNRRE